MPRLSPRAITQHAYNAGFEGADLVRAVAVALAESSGDTDAVSSTGCCIGLWQINVRVHKQYTVADMRDPAKNASAAFALKQADGWRPWNSSRAGQALTSALAASTVAIFMASNPVRTAADVALGPAADIAGNIAGATGIPQAIEAANLIGKWVSTPANWLRVAYVLVGGALVIGSLIVLSRPITEPVVKTAAKVATKL